MGVKGKPEWKISMDRSREIFNKAQKVLKRDEMNGFLAFSYGLMSSSMRERHFASLEEYIDKHIGAREIEVAIKK